MNFIKKSLLWLAAFGIFTACSQDDINKVLPSIDSDDFLDGKGMIKITKNIGEWDAGVMFQKNGYILYKEQDADNENLSYLQLMSPESQYDCALYLDKRTNLPEILTFGEETYYFDNQEDSLILILKNTPEGTNLIDSIPFQLSFSNETPHRNTRAKNIITIFNQHDDIQKAIKALNDVLATGTEYTSGQIRKLKNALNKISMLYYYDNVENIIDSLSLCKDIYGENNDSIVFCFAKQATELKVKKLNHMKNCINVRTYPFGAYKVSSNSAVVGGWVYCPNEMFRTVGRWGCIYSKNTRTPSMRNCDGKVYASQNSNKNFKVVLDKLTPGTTYYYKAFYEFTTANHKDLVFTYDNNENAQYYVPGWIASTFTTEGKVEGIIHSVKQTSAICHRNKSSEPLHIDFTYNIHASIAGDEDITEWGVYVYNFNGNGEYYYLPAGDQTSSSNIIMTCTVEKQDFDNINYSSYTATEELQMGIYKITSIGTYDHTDPQIYKLVYKQEPNVKIINCVQGETVPYSDPEEVDWLTYAYWQYEISGAFFIDDIFYFNSGSLKPKGKRKIEGSVDITDGTHQFIGHYYHGDLEDESESHGYTYMGITTHGKDILSRNYIEIDWTGIKIWLSNAIRSLESKSVKSYYSDRIGGIIHVKPVKLTTKEEQSHCNHSKTSLY